MAGSTTRAAPDLSRGPLSGIRVLDLATMLAGPYAATLLGDLGADVIKVESFIGDDSRHLGPRRGDQRTSFLSLNRNKRGIAIDLREAGAREVFARLVATTDILITNIREPALSNLGVDYETVRAHAPEIIWIGVTAFGPDGPYAGRPGIDFLAQGYAGLLAMNGRPGEDPVRVTVPVIDVMTSELVCTSALAAVIARGQTGEGQRIDVSLLDALVHAQAPNIGCWVNGGEDPPRTGNRSQYFSPSGVYPTRDGKQVVITCPSDKFFHNLCVALEVDLADDPRFADVEQRMQHEEELDALLHEHCGRFDREDLVERLVAADVPRDRRPGEAPRHAGWSPRAAAAPGSAHG
jgi:crotonobetainyl-CoA:carnitine CoA-transferase CaiB-like acyl-CoA transferase